MSMTRRQGREVVFSLIYEAEFHTDLSFAQIYEDVMNDLSQDGTDHLKFEEDHYVRSVFFGIGEKLEELDTLISAHTVGWKLDRLSKVSHAIMRLCTYEMLYVDDVPAPVAINEALELAKKYDHDKAPAFINGVVNAIAHEKNLISES